MQYRELTNYKNFYGCINLPNLDVIHGLLPCKCGFKKVYD